MFGYWRRWLFVFTVMVTLLFSLPSFAAVKIGDLRFSISGKYARMEIDVSGKAGFKAFSLSRPDRIVIDVDSGKMPNTKPNIIDGILVNDVRYGKPNKDTVRVVLDMSEPVKIVDSVLKEATRNFPQNKIIISYTSLSGRMPYFNRTKDNSEFEIPASMRYSYKGKTPFDIPTFKPFSIKGYGKEGLNPTISRPRHLNTEIVEAKPTKKPLIILDAGHGGVDPGAIGKKGTKEKLITLSFVKELKSILENTGMYRVALTRSSDKYINLKQRVARAQKADGDIFISIHADSHKNSRTRGLSVYTISENRSKREANKLYKKSRKSNVLSGVDLQKESSDVRGVLIDLARRDTKNTSIRFAEIIVKELGDDAKLLDRTHRHASLGVLTGMEIPSVLVELGYLSNSYEEGKLRTKTYRQKLAGGIKDALNKYFSYDKAGKNIGG